MGYSCIMRSMSTDASKFKKTKIVATIGPAVEDKIESLLRAGVNGIRLNFSHNTHAWHADIIRKVRVAAKKLDRSVAIIADLQGPKLRLGSLPSGGVEIKTGQTLKFKHGSKYEESGTLPIQFDFSAEIKRDDAIFLRDGQVKCVVTGVRDGVISARAINSGKVSTNHGINLPDTQLLGTSMTTKDRKDISFLLGQDIDYIALSFIHRASDIEDLQAIIRRGKRSIGVIAKIETKVATKHLDEIIQAADAAMIARGDLAIETAPEEVPLIGREIILLARRYKRPVIMATQMLEGMMNSTQPSRAEANDVATAVSLGVDAVMLSGETAAGQYPLETVRMMKRIVLSSELYFARARTEIDLIPEGETSLGQYPIESVGLMKRVVNRTRRIFSQAENSAKISSGDIQTSVGLAAITLAEQVGVKLILAETLTGSTALTIASLRPSVPIIIASPNESVCNKTAIVWGGKPFLVPQKQKISGGVMTRLKRRGNVASGDLIVLAFGKNHNIAGGTDTVRLIEVP